MYIVPTGVGSNPNVTVATVHTMPAGTASVTYATLGQVPGFEGIAPYTYMPVMHLDTQRGQMIAALQGLSSRPPAALRGAAPRPKVGDLGDLFLVIADVFPANGTVSKVWLDLTEQDARWGSGSISGVSAFDGAAFWLNPISGNVPSGQALYGFPLNGSAPMVVPYGSLINLEHLFFSQVRGGLLAVIDDDNQQPILARFSHTATPPFTTIFKWNLTGGEQSEGLYDVSPDGTKLLSVLVDKNGGNPVMSILDLTQLKEIKRITLQGFSSSEGLCDVNWCNVD